MKYPLRASASYLCESGKLVFVGGILPDRIRKDVGRGGEQIASQFLLRKGYKVLAHNYRRKWGEIDIIALKGNTVRFIEVKAVSLPNGKFSREIDQLPEELVHRTKLRKVARTAALYMEERGDKREYQIDVVGVILNHKTRTARCRLFEQALEENL